MFAISDKHNSYKSLNRAFITIEGNSKHEDKFFNLILSLGNDVMIINKENKHLYHAASVTVSNLVLGLINTGVKYLIECGFEEEMAIKALQPLISFSIENIKEIGIVNSLTGPIERGDIKTLESHCNGQILVYQDMLGMFNDFTPKFVKKYADLGESMKVAFKRYIEEVSDGVFPEETHTFKINDEVLEKLY